MEMKGVMIAVRPRVEKIKDGRGQVENKECVMHVTKASRIFVLQRGCLGGSLGEAYDRDKRQAF